jgi:hypothetical protein
MTKTPRWLPGLVLAVAGVMLLVLPGRANLKMDEIMALVPGDQTVAAIMAPGTLPALAEIAEKLREAASKNPEWWREYAQQTPPGEPLPYHAKMEIDEEEYAEYVTLAGGPQVIQFGKLLLEVTSPQKGVFRISAGDTVPEMDGIEIDLVRDRISTPFGQAAKRTNVDPDASSQKLTGPWEGVQWEYDRFNVVDKTGLSIQFALGRLDDSGRGILYYRVLQRGAHDAPREVMILLFYPLKKQS